MTYRQIWTDCHTTNKMTHHCQNGQYLPTLIPCFKNMITVFFSFVFKNVLKSIFPSLQNNELKQFALGQLSVLNCFWSFVLEKCDPESERDIESFSNQLKFSKAKNKMKPLKARCYALHSLLLQIYCLDCAVYL